MRAFVSFKFVLLVHFIVGWVVCAVFTFASFTRSLSTACNETKGMNTEQTNHPTTHSRFFVSCCCCSLCFLFSSVRFTLPFLCVHFIVNERKEKRAQSKQQHIPFILCSFVLPLSFILNTRNAWFKMKKEEKHKWKKEVRNVLCCVHFVRFVLHYHTITTEQRRTQHTTVIPGSHSQGFLGPFPFSSFPFCVVMKARTKREKRKEEKNPRTEWKKQKEQRKMNGARFTCPFISLCSFPSFHSLYPPHGLGLSLPSHSTKYKWQGIAWFSWMKKEAKEPKTIEWHLSWSCVLCVWFQLNKACVSLTFVTIELNTKDTTRTHFSFHFPFNYNGNQVKRELSGKERKEKWVLCAFFLLCFCSARASFHSIAAEQKTKRKKETQHSILLLED